MMRIKTIKSSKFHIKQRRVNTEGDITKWQKAENLAFIETITGFKEREDIEEMRVIKSESFSQEDTNTENNKSNSNDKVKNLLKLYIPDPFERV